MTALDGIAERLDRLPPSRFMRRLVARISIGGWFEFYDLFMSAYISLGLFKEGLFSSTGSGVGAFASFVGAGFLGMFGGTLIFGWVSDRFGRRVTFVWSLTFYSVMTLAMALMPSALLIDIFRCLAGLGIGVQIITIDSYISEVVPTPQRGRFIAFSQALTYSAVPVVALLSTLLVPHAIAGISGWRWVSMIGSLGVLFVRPLQHGLPESPRWLQAHGDARRAEESVLSIETAVRAQGHELSPPRPQPSGTTYPVASWWEMWSPIYRLRSFMLIAFNFFQTIGFYGFVSWVPILLFKEGVSYVHSLWYTFAIALASPLGPLVAMYVADRFERKRQVVNLAAAIGVLGLMFAQMRGPLGIISTGLAITVANNWFSCAFHAYQAELYPTRIRARAVGFVYSWSRFSAVFVGFWIAYALSRFGANGVFILIAAAMSVAALIVSCAGPLTNRKPLEMLAP